MYDFKGKTALVTGGARGIGRAIAVELARGGASLALNDVNEALGPEAIELVQKAGAPRAKFYKFDVSDGGACNAAVEAIIADFGSLNILVNNAGVSRDQTIALFKDEDWNLHIQVNLTGTFNLTRAVARPMMKQKGGVIVNIASVVGEMGNRGQAAYAASKAGIIGLTKSVARDLASRGIRVNAVAPGYIDTPMTQALPEAARAKLAEAIPLARLGTAQDVADAVAWLASEKASYVTGAVIRVNGGMYM